MIFKKKHFNITRWALIAYILFPVNWVRVSDTKSRVQKTINANRRKCIHTGKFSLCVFSFSLLSFSYTFLKELFLFLYSTLFQFLLHCVLTSASFKHFLCFVQSFPDHSSPFIVYIVIYSHKTLVINHVFIQYLFF